MEIKQKIAILILSLSIFMGFMLNSEGVEGSVSRSQLAIDSAVPKTRAFSCFLPVYDTVYIESDRYVELDLLKQRAFLIKRDGSCDSFKISSGNPNVKKGIVTSTGIFTVQSKTPIAVSKQFNNAEMYHWIGFNGNIGIHGLKGTGYYSTLGLRPSSHGCVRIAREDGEKLYREVRRGTPVIVHSGAPARIFAFLDSNRVPSNAMFLSGKFKYEKKYLDNRLKNVYKGYAVNNIRTSLILDGKTILRGSEFQTGDYNKIPARQSDLFISIPRTENFRDITRVCSIYDKTAKIKNVDVKADTVKKALNIRQAKKSKKK